MLSTVCPRYDSFSFPQMRFGNDIENAKKSVSSLVSKEGNNINSNQDLL